MQNDVVLYTFHLFAGAGGGILADVLLGHRPIGAVEIEQYPRDVLLRHQLTGELPNFPIWDDVRSFSIDNDATRQFIERLRGIRENLCISGGFPCQGCSAAGKGLGLKDPRSGLWREFARIVGEIRPRYVFLENSNLLIRRGLETILSDVTAMGYSCAWGVISAADVGAPHKRQRFWAVCSLHTHTTNANSNGARQQRNSIGGDNEQTQFRPDELRCSLPDAGNKNNGRLYGEQEESDEQSKPDCGRKTFDVCRKRREIESRLGGMANGLSDWLDENLNGTLWQPDEKGIPRIVPVCKDRAKRLKAIGNAQVPLCAAVAFETLKEILERYDC